MLELSKSKNFTWVKIHSILIYMGEGREGGEEGEEEEVFKH